MARETITIEYPEAFYSLFNTSCKGLPAVVVVNGALREFPHRGIFPWHLSVIITPRDFAEHGMPTPEEVHVLDAVGDEIEAGVIGQRNALFLARETWNGTRQLLFRVNDPDVANEFLQTLIARSDQRREWQFEMERDPTWSFAEEMFSLFEKAGGSDA